MSSSNSGAVLLNIGTKARPVDPRGGSLVDRHNSRKRACDWEDHAIAIGGTPLVRLQRIAAAAPVELWAKLEACNPSGSVKCRIGGAMILDAERRGLLRPGMTIIEPTSGNTGIALAWIGAVRGYRVVLTMPASMSWERSQVLAAYGAKVVLTDPAQEMTGAVTRAQQIVDSDPDRYFMPQQFTNPVNPAIHAQTTGPEIWQDTAGRIDVLVCGVGTGGTLCGTVRALKARKPGVLSVAVEPSECATISQALAGRKIRPGMHRIQGIGAGFIPAVLDLSLIDRVEQVSSDEAEDFTRRLAREEGLLCGPSSGAAIAAAVRLAHQPAFAGQTIVTILADAGERYLSTGLFGPCTMARGAQTGNPRSLGSA